MIGFNIQPADRKKGVPGRFMSGSFVLRLAEERNWLPIARSLIRALVPKASELTPARFEGQVYYAAHWPRLGANAGVYFPDRRTIVYAREEEIRAMIRRPAKLGPSFVLGDHWQQASRGLYAIAINNADQRLKLELNSENPVTFPSRRSWRRRNASSSASMWATR